MGTTWRSRKGSGPTSRPRSCGCSPSSAAERASFAQRSLPRVLLHLLLDALLLDALLGLLLDVLRSALVLRVSHGRFLPSKPARQRTPAASGSIERLRTLPSSRDPEEVADRTAPALLQRVRRHEEQLRRHERIVQRMVRLLDRHPEPGGSGGERVVPGYTVK